MTGQFLFEAIGTHWQIDFEAPDGFDEKKLLKSIKRRINKFDKNYSRFRDDSLVSKIAMKKGIYKMPRDAKKMFEFYKDLYELTNGIVTPLIGHVMVDAGYDKNYSLITKKLTHPPRWGDSINFKQPSLEVKKPVLLDFGAAGKGYLVDIVSNVLIKKGINKFCVDAGGDIYCHNLKQKVGLEHPSDATQVIGTYDINNESICGSAGNRRRWGKFNHIINPHTLRAVTNIKAVWVISRETMIADGIATALFFIEPDKLMGSFDFSYLIVYEDMTIKKSENFRGELFIQEAL